MRRGLLGSLEEAPPTTVAGADTVGMIVGVAEALRGAPELVEAWSPEWGDEGSVLTMVA